MMKRPGKLIERGFNLIELMVALVIVGALTAIVVPQYRNYVVRSRLTEAFAALGAVQLTAEQFWSNNRTYVGLTPLPTDTSHFSYALSGASSSAYTVTATGLGELDGFAFTINQSATRATTSVPTGWTANNGCWVDHADGSCTQ
jgi:type IV pilus assembly protein PilE